MNYAKVKLSNLKKYAIGIIESDLPSQVKYKKLVIALMPLRLIKRPVLVKGVTPVLHKMYSDVSTWELCKDVYPNLRLEVTEEFLQFLNKITANV
jgi:hypothetical protein